MTAVLAALCPRAAGGSVVGAWARAGVLWGGVLGAALGACIPWLAGSPAYALLGLQVGAVLGGCSGLIVGTLDGVVLASLSRLSVIRSDTPGRATAAAMITTGGAGLVVQRTFVSGLPAPAPLLALGLVPSALGVLLAAVLSRRLPTGAR